MSVSNPRVTASDDVLDYAITSVLFVMVAVVVVVPLPYFAVVCVGVVGFITAFTVTPYVVAWWVDEPVSELTQPPRR